MPQPTIPTLPDAPSRAQSPSTFSDDADTWVAALPAFGVAIDDMGTYVTSQATDATTAAANAASSESVALAASNFKGTWASLVGALNKPASVYHNGQYWMLLTNLADVTTSQPGVSADWQRIGWSLTPVVTAVSVAALQWQHIYVTASGQTITLPATVSAGDEVAVSVGVFSDTVIARNGLKIMSLTEDLTVDSPSSTVNLRYIDATRGWVIV